MKFASLTDHPMDQFKTQAEKVENSLEWLFGRWLYYDMVNFKSHPKNLIFFLRPAKKTELRHLECGLQHGSASERAAVVALREIARESLPCPIANFRFVRDEENPLNVFLVNDHGETSSSRSIDFFVTKLKASLFVRCFNLGNYCWHGSSAMIKPFMEFCLAGENSVGERACTEMRVDFPASNN